MRLVLWPFEATTCGLWGRLQTFQKRELGAARPLGADLPRGGQAPARCHGLHGYLGGLFGGVFDHLGLRVEYTLEGLRKFRSFPFRPVV